MWARRRCASESLSERMLRGAATVLRDRGVVWPSTTAAARSEMPDATTHGGVRSLARGEDAGKTAIGMGSGWRLSPLPKKQR
jgi:hypothetical protein